MLKALIGLAATCLVGYAADYYRNRVLFIGGLLPYIGWRTIWLNEHTRVRGFFAMWLWRAVSWAPTVTMYGDTDDQN